MSLQERKKQFRFDQLTTIQPKQKLNLETKDGRMTTRVLDLFCPIGKGQRSLIVAPPRAGKTTILHDIAKGVEENWSRCASSRQPERRARVAAAAAAARAHAAVR